MTQNRPRISVIINFLNTEAFLQEAIESVLSQIYYDWEVLLVDDGSTDGSTAIAKEYVARFPCKVKYLEHDNHQNKGSSAARNLGIRKALGEYIAFLDADDIWYPDKLQRQTEILDGAPEAAMVVGSPRVWHSWSELYSRDEDYDLVHSYACDCVVEPPKVLQAFLSNEGDTPFPSGMLIRRRIAEEIGGFEEEFRGMADDQVFCAKIGLAYPIYVSQHPVFKYRIQPNSLCQTAIAKGEISLARGRFLEWLQTYLESRVKKDSALWQELRRQSWRYRHPLLRKALRMPASLKRLLLRTAASVARLLLSADVYNRLRERRQKTKH